MATEAVFQAKFIKPLVDCYGQIKFPGIRVQKIWERLKVYPDHLLALCADKIILNFDNFPGIQAILNTCAEVVGEQSKEESERIKASVICFKCRSQGVVVVNNNAYKCNCQLGDLLYPAYPVYAGQVQFKEKIFYEEDGTKIIEDANYIHIIPVNKKSIRDIRTIIKQPKSNIVELDKTDFKRMSFNDFAPKDLA